MDDKTKELARQYMNKASETIPHADKFPVKLCDEQSMTVRILGLYGSMVESRGVDFQMDDNTIAKVEKVVKWMYGSKKHGLLLCGTLGNGKTTMLRTLKYLFGSKAVYMEAQQAYDFFKQNQVLPSISPTDILLIDDLGVEPSSYNDFGEMRYPLAELLMNRYKMNSTTVIATNFTFEQIGQTYGDRIQDRMREMFAMISYTEPSYRK